MKIKSITSRWVINTLGIIILILTVINVGFALSIQNYFYNTAEQLLVSAATSNFHLIQLYSSDMTKNINNEIRSVVENFSSKDKIEVMALNFSGEVTYTSSGFDAGGSNLNNPPDYDQALTSPDSVGSYIGYLDNGEHVMAYTQLVLVTNNEFSALRYMISLEDIDALIFRMVLSFIGISVVVLLFVVVSGSFFVNSIVRPVRDISAAVKKIAAGDMHVRVRHKSKDELGELCDTINYMADELATTEQMQNEFISSVSHELRTPLTAIQGWSETILSVGTDDRSTVQKGMRVITNETGRLAEMVEELLDFSRIQNGRFKLIKDKMDVFAELEESVLIYTERAHRDGKTLIFEEENKLPVIFGDKNRIRQVFINIIDNALKYSDPGDTVAIKAQVCETEDVVIITVSDTGCGIADRDLPRVKEKFYKANNTRRGSGIGLAVAVEIIDMHNGQLDISSQEGEGTTVIIKIPIYHGADEQVIEEFPSQ